MKKENRFVSVISIYSIVLIVYTIGFLIIPFEKIAASWISFAFTIVAIICSMVTCNISFGTNKSLGSMIYGYPIFRIGIIYSITQFILGILVCIISTFFAVPYWIALLIYLILLAAALIGIIITKNTRDMVEEIDQKNEVDTQTIIYFQLNIDGIIDDCEDPSIKEKLLRLSDQFKFSDPVSNDATKDIELQIEQEIQILKELIYNSDNDSVSEKVKVVSSLLAERNRICQASKR